MEKPTFIRANLSNVRVIMVIMRVLVEELLCQAVMGHVLGLKCLFVMCTWVHVVTSCHVLH
jgi:hypothetical protein